MKNIINYYSTWTVDGLSQAQQMICCKVTSCKYLIFKMTVQRKEDEMKKDWKEEKHQSNPSGEKLLM